MSVLLRMGARGVRSSLAAFTLALLVAAGLAEAAAAPKVPGPKPHRYKARVFSGPSGSRSSFTAIADDGTAVGQIILADGFSHSTRLSHKKKSGGSPLAGKQSFLSAIDVRDEAVGTVITPSAQNPLYLSGSNAIILRGSETRPGSRSDLRWRS